MMYNPIKNPVGDVHELRPLRRDTRKSFYGKAIFYLVAPGKMVLQSYSTIVSEAYFDRKEKIWRVEHKGKFSVTTSRHQREFEAQCRTNTFSH